MVLHFAISLIIALAEAGYSIAYVSIERIKRMNELIVATACEITARLRKKEISPLELIDATVARIAEVNDLVNAVPTLCIDRARGRAASLAPDCLLAGLPILAKDLVDVAGVRTTHGSRVFSDYVPEASNFLIDKLEANGALVVGKTNTPEFGAGANTFNEVFGRTVNPYDTALTCGGSSGGSAVALATGMAWLATGSDLGGSLRIPAAFCNVVGFRPSPGRVPHGPTLEPFTPMWIDGPMGRNVADVALFLDAMCGYDRRDPLTYEPPAVSYLSAASDPEAPTRVGFSTDLGITPVDNEVAAICSASIRKLERMGTDVIETCPDFSSAHDAFATLRAASYATVFEKTLGSHRDKLKPEVIGNIEQGLALKAADIGLAERQRAALCADMAVFFGEHDVLATPCVAVPPFPVEIRYLEEINGKKMTSYVEWLALTYATTLTSCPAISVPCGFTEAGLPVGMQLVGRPRGEAKLLQVAAAFEAEMGLPQLPIDPVN